MRNEEKIWYCLRDDKANSEMDEYLAPKELILRMPSIFSPVSITVQPLNGFTDRMAYGETTSKYQRIVLTPYQYWYGKFKEGDLFYLDGQSPQDDEQYYGEYANYVVDNVANQNQSIEVTVKKIIEK